MLGRFGARKAYLEGRGTRIMRAKTRVEEFRKTGLPSSSERFAIGHKSTMNRKDRRTSAREEVDGASPMFRK